MNSSQTINPIFRFLFLIFCGTLLCTSCSTSRKIDKQFDEGKEFEKGFSGLAIYDLENDEMIYERNSGKYFTPASNTKLFTFHTGLKILGDSVPGLKYIVRNDSLIFTGTGDPSFLNSDLPASTVYDFLKNRRENLYYAPPAYEEEFFGPGWAWDDYNSYYSVERTVFPIYGNRVSFKILEGVAPPKVMPEIFRDSLAVIKSSSNFSEIKRAISQNRFTYSEKNLPDNFQQNVPFKYSSKLLVQLLRDTLQREVTLLEAAPKGFEDAKVLYSIPADSIYKTMLQVSDNFLAEQILLMAAGKISDSLNSEIAIDHMKENYLQNLPDEPKWVDGSGLSRYNLFTPRSMIALLELIYEEVPRERLFNLLAVGGVSGTIKNNYKGSPPYIFAKTGTLRNNHSLSGYLVASSGKTYAFSFMNSNYVVPTSEIKKQMEIILRKIYEEN